MVVYPNLIEVQGLKPIVLSILNLAAEEAAEKVSYFVIPRHAACLGMTKFEFFRNL
jgi:hypothetical protein